MRKLVISCLGLAAACILTLAQATIADAAPAGQVAWVGSPIAGAVSSPPTSHSPKYGGQWAVDISTTSAQSANVYVAVDPTRDPHLSTRIVSVNYACGPISGETAANRLARGGKMVTVGVYYDGTQIGRLNYAHLDSPLAIGNYNTALSRWGGSLGTVGSYKVQKKPDGTYCWTGRHVHFESQNLSGTSCYWSGLSKDAALPQHSYLGYVGYRSPAKACPSRI